MTQLGFRETPFTKSFPMSSCDVATPSVDTQDKKVFLGIPQTTVNAIIGVSYGVYLILNSVALVLLIFNESYLSFAYFTALSIACLHFFFLLFGEMFVSFYVAYPIQPMILYLTSDFVLATSAGTLIATLDDRKEIWAFLSNGASIVSQLLCFRKTYVTMFNGKN